MATTRPTRSDQPPRTAPPWNNHPAIVPAGAEILWMASRTADQTTLLEEVLPVILISARADYGALAAATAGRWATLTEAGSGRSLPVELLADVADREVAAVGIGTDPGWIAAPLMPQTADRETLVLHCPAGIEPAAVLSVAECLTPVLSEALASVRRRDRQSRRIRQLEAMLEIANRWNQTHEVEPLLTQMAEAATRLLDAGRASIFLWDRPNRLLVGRPALGISNGELRIADDRGVVGQVVHSGEPRRVDVAAEPNQVDHDVDAQLRYQTKTLLCVPLRGSSGELFGAFELINKRWGSFSEEDEAVLIELAAHAAIALENAQNRQQLLSVNRQIADQAAEGIRLIGHSPAIKALRSIVRRVADTDLAVLVLGENGTGKEIVAQSIHYLSRRRDKPFIAVNCAAIPETLAESELFGHEKGAFTDAREARAGKFELAAGGTLFLDEIGDLSLACQAKLLRVLEERTLIRVGGSTPIHSDARVLAATNQNLAEMVRQKRFREDLYFRLNVVTIELPPLRNRAGDILLLAEHFLRDFCQKARRKVPKFTSAAETRLADHPWPGNVRELRNLMERLAYLSTEDRIEVVDLAFILSPRGQTPRAGNFDQALAEATVQFQVQYIRQAIAQADGNMSRAATRLGLHRSNLYRKMRQLGMETPE